MDEKIDPTAVYAKLYENGVVILSSYDYTDTNRVLIEDYGDISKEEYNLSNGKTPGWLKLNYDERLEEYQIRRGASEIIIYDVIAPINVNLWFNNSNKIENLINLNTSNITDMSGMFSKYGGTELNVSHFNTGNVTNMSSMFNDCADLNALDVSNFDTSNVTCMNGMFANCRRLESMDISKFNTSNVNNMSSMFRNCTELKALNINKIDTSSVTNFDGMFYCCINLENIDTSNIRFTSDIYTSEMFEDCKKIQYINLRNASDGSVKLYAYKMFKGCSNLKNIYLGTTKFSNADSMFSDCITLGEIEFVDGALSGCSCNYIFENCSNLKKVKLGAFDCSGNRYSGDFQCGFVNCVSLTSIDLTGCYNSDDLDLYNAFVDCIMLREVKLPERGSSSNLSIFTNTFSGCTSLENLDFNFKDGTSLRGLDFTSTFENCSSLKTVSFLGAKDAIGVHPELNATFKGCTSLESVLMQESLRIYVEISDNTFEGARISEITFVDNTEI